MSRARAQSGQAAVEWLAAGLLVAALLLAAGLWLAREGRSAADPPPVIEAVARPLLDGPPSAPPGGAVAYPFVIGPGGGDEPIGRILRAIGRSGVEAVRFGAEVRVAFDQAFARRLSERGAAIVRDPVGSLSRLPEESLFSPREALRRGLGNALRIWAYAEELRSMPLRRAAVRAAGDAGRLTADALVEAGQVALRRRLAREGPPPPPAPPPPPSPSPGRR